MHLAGATQVSRWNSATKISRLKTKTAFLSDWANRKHTMAENQSDDIKTPEYDISRLQSKAARIHGISLSNQN